MTNDSEKGLRILIRDLLGMPSGSVRPQDNQPIDGDDFAIMRITSTDQMGWAGSNANSQQSSIDTVTLDFFGKKARHHANQLKIAMQSAYAIEQMLKLKLGFIDCDTGRDLTALELDTIKRYQVRMRVSYSESYDRPNNLPSDEYIEQVPVGMIAEP